MKIKIEAYICAPGLLQFIGEVNPIIFTGIFEQKISAKEKARLKQGHKITCQGIELTIRKIRGKKTFVCDGQLPSVSVCFFAKLKKAGWKIDKKSADMYCFPNDAVNKYLQDQIKEHREKNKRYANASENLNKAYRKWAIKDFKKQKKKKERPFENFPQVH